MRQIERHVLIYVLRLLLLPLARFCVRHSLMFQDFLDCSKESFIKAARQELDSSSHQVTSSRLSIMTGIHRREVSKFKGPVLADEQTSGGLIRKVIGQWQTDSRFLTIRGKPRTLNLGQKSEFAELIRSVSKDLNPATVLFELERLESVIKTDKGVRLTTETHVPRGDPIEGFNYLGRDAEDIVSTVEENVLEDPEIPQLHLRLEYDKVRQDVSEKIKMWFLKEGHAFQIRARDYVSQFDQDVNPELGYKGKFLRVVLSTFSNVKIWP